ncbi:MAG: type III secretion system export apparatus subunit SctT [Pseudomonadota bacterium]|nr:type III secretion system export apparatus subunit SctT [Pseudomonadota bacterium]
MGEAFLAAGNLGDLALLAALASTRFALAFLLLPILAQDTVPQMVRGAIFLSFGVITLAMQPMVNVHPFGVGDWIGLFAREAFIGLALGMLLAAVLWAFAAAGEVVDGASGMGQAQVVDPLSGRQTSVSGAFLGRLAVFVFMAAGGLMLWVGVLMESFVLWPLAQPGLSIKGVGVALFETAFAHFAGLTFMMAAPALVVLYAIDLSLGLMNRYAPQLNLISISMSLKGLAAVLVWLVMLGTLVQTLLDQLAALLPNLLTQVQSLMR